ncbi:MAG: heparan-alpha-glucosaminide N-acetyltransferase domain-containing protein [Chloroflexota bacterium]|nr:heparan-alpha-glucosaminide N-acetyltransferase domain-containing protein [Chloroflexota bacterium]
MKRVHSIDILRALAIGWMVQIHFVDNLGYSSQHDTFIYSIAGWLGIVPAPLFTFLAGMSLFISLSKYPPETGRRQTLRRGLAVFVIGLVHYLINWGAEYLLDWDILTFIGSALLIVYLLRKVNLAGIVAIILSIIAISPFLRVATGYNLHWNFILREYTHAWTLKDIFLGWSLQGYFPVLPWIIFPLAGYATGRSVLGENSPQRQRTRGWVTAGVGVASTAVGMLGVRDYMPYGYSSPTGLRPTEWVRPTMWGVHLSPITFYPASTTYLLILLGICLTSFAGLWLLLDAVSQSPWRAKWEQSRLFTVVQRYSRYSLSVYVIHHSVHLWPLYLAGWLYAGDRWYYYADAIPMWIALSLWGLFIAAFYFVVARWEKVNGRYSLEWVLARFVKG